jgi:hypothetical protein
MKVTVSAIRQALHVVKNKVLAFRKKPKDSWLMPKVYKGKSMHQEELDRLGKK